MGGDFITSLIIVLIGLVTAGAGIAGTVGITKKISKNKAHSVEKALRNELAEKYVNHVKVRALVKKYFKNQIKAASPTVARKAKLNYMILKGAPERKIRKIRLFDEKQIVENGAFSHVEKVIYDQKSNLSFELPSNSILTYSKSIADDYKLALSSTQNSGHFNNYFNNRNYKGGTYPLELTITDNDGKKVAFLSDVSAERFYEFTQKIMAKLNSDLDNQKSYTITMVDTAVNSKRGVSQISYAVKSDADCNEAVDGLNNCMFNLFKGFHSDKIKTVDYKDLISLYKYENQTPKVSSTEALTSKDLLIGKISYKEANLQSKFLDEMYNKKTNEFRYQNDDNERYITSLVFNGKEIVTFSSENTDVKHSMEKYLAAYAFVKAYDNYYDNNIRNKVEISTKTLDTKTLSVKEISRDTLGDFYNMYSSYKDEQNFSNAVKEIADEKNIVIEAKKVKNPDFVSKKMASKNLGQKEYGVKITTSRPKLETMFNNDYKAQTDKASIAYSTKITNNLNTKNNVNLKMETNSKTIQRTYFYQLMLEAYVIGKTELNETKTFSPITIAVDFSTLSPTFEEKPKNKQETYKTLDELKQNIMAYARYNFNTAYSNDDFESEIKKVEDDFKVANASTFNFN